MEKKYFDIIFSNLSINNQKNILGYLNKISLGDRLIKTENKKLTIKEEQSSYCFKLKKQEADCLCFKAQKTQKKLVIVNF